MGFFRLHGVHNKKWKPEVIQQANTIFYSLRKSEIEDSQTQAVTPYIHSRQELSGRLSLSQKQGEDKAQGSNSEQVGRQPKETEPSSSGLLSNSTQATLKKSKLSLDSATAR